MRVLFTHSYFYKLDAKQWRFKQPYPPLGTIQAAAVIREKGYHVSLFDTALRSSPDELNDFLRRQHADYLVIYDDGFNYLTKMCLTAMREAAFSLARTGKKFGCTVIVSSSDAHDHYEKYLMHGVDYVVLGEGEQTLEELLTILDARGDVSHVQGIAYKKSAVAITTGSRPVMRTLDALPMPAWDLVNIGSYRRIWKRHHGYFSLNIATTRGCPYKCNWCAKPIYGNRYNSRSPAHVVNEIQLLLEKYKPDHLWMCDDIFGLKPGWVKAFSDLVKTKGLKFRYKIQSRADLLLEPDTIDALAQSGAQTVWIGAESGSQKILDAMDKGTTVTQIEQATLLLRDRNIRVAFFLQFGYMGETQEDIEQTIRMVLKLLPDEVGISVSYPLPGTKFYDKVKDQLREKANWRDSDDLAMMFESTFNNAYYRQLHRYVHSIYRQHKGYHSIKQVLSNPFNLTYKDLRDGTATLYYLPKTFAQRLKLKRLERV